MYDMAQGTICDYCKDFYPRDAMYRMSKEINSIKIQGKSKHVCKKCCAKMLKFV